jgi:predicted transcriptional regulator
MDAVIYWLGTREEEIHFIDAVISAYDGLANVRREFKIEGGETLYRVYVAPGMEDEFLALVARLRGAAGIGRLIREGEARVASP